ncbi:MAG TPA: type II 3-dehydroquinate dehydratase [Actinomycetota bacterium]|nr:type II 3-dehydroquinate dehydratase [Actinomycetota bacterium]
MKVLFLFGPNLGALGTRDPDRYGTQTLVEIMVEVAARATRLGHEIAWRQSELEADLVAWTGGAADEGFSAIAINAGALSHYSEPLHDAIAATPVPTIEVHQTNIYAREAFRRHSTIAPACRVTIAGAGVGGYHLALEALPWITD